MRKKIMVVAFLIMVLCLMAGLVFYIRQGKETVRIEDVLAAGPIFYAQTADLEKNVHDFQETAFVQRLREIDFQGQMEAWGAGAQEMAFYDSLKERVFSEKNFQFFLALFGREAAAAFYPLSLQEESAGVSSKDSVFSHLSVAVRLNSGSRFADMLMGAVSGVHPDVTRTEEDYRGEKIFRLNIRGVDDPVVYVRFHDLLVFGLGDTAARRAVDVFRYGAAPLSEDTAFLEMDQARVDGAETAGFFHYQLFSEKMSRGLMSFYEETGEDVDAEIQRQMEAGFEGAQGIRALYFSLRYGRVLHGLTRMTYDEGRAPEFLRDASQAYPRENQSLAFVPNTVKMYFWNGFFQPRFYWDRWKSRQGNTGAGGQQPGFGKNMFGMDMDAAVAVLEDEIGWYFFGMDLKGPVPLPHGVLFARVNDMDQAETLVRQAVESSGMLRTGREIYKGKEIGYVEGIPFFAALEPAYCVMNDYIFLAVNRGLIRQAIDTYESAGNSFKDHTCFRENPGLVRPGQGFFFGQVSSLAQDAADILRWGNQWADARAAQEQSFQEGARKRLENVVRDAAAKEAEVNSLEEMLAEKRSRQESLVVLPEVREDLAREMNRQERILENVQKALNSVVEQERELARIEREEPHRLTESGRRLLEELREDLQKRRLRVQGVEGEIGALKARQRQLDEDERMALELQAQIAEGEKSAAEKRDQIRILLETQAELEQLIEGYEQAAPPGARHREMFLKGLAEPLLKALAEIQWFAVQSGVSAGRVQSEFFIEVK